MRQPAAQNPFCWHWRLSVRGTLMSHLILGVDSLVPGPGLVSELAWCLPKPWMAGRKSRALGGPSCCSDGGLCTQEGGGLSQSR